MRATRAYGQRLAPPCRLLHPCGCNRGRCSSVEMVESDQNGPPPKNIARSSDSVAERTAEMHAATDVAALNAKDKASADKDAAVAAAQQLESARAAAKSARAKDAAADEQIATLRKQLADAEGSKSTAHTAALHADSAKREATRKVQEAQEAAERSSAEAAEAAKAAAKAEAAAEAARAAEAAEKAEAAASAEAEAAEQAVVVAADKAAATKAVAAAAAEATARARAAAAAAEAAVVTAAAKLADKVVEPEEAAEVAAEAPTAPAPTPAPTPSPMPAPLAAPEPQPVPPQPSAANEVVDGPAVHAELAPATFALVPPAVGAVELPAAHTPALTAAPTVAAATAPAAATAVATAMAISRDEPISLVVPAAESKTQRLAGQAYPLLLRILFRGDPSTQLLARSASQLAGRSAQLHHGQSRTLVPELRGHCEPVRGPFGQVASGASQSGGVRLLQKKRGPRASIGFRTRDALATGGGCGGPGGGIGGVGLGVGAGGSGGSGSGGGPLPPCTASLRLGSEWSFCCHLRLPLPEPPPTAAEKRRVRTLAMGLSREGRAVRHVLMLEEQMADGKARLTLGVDDGEVPELAALNLHALPHGWHSLAAVGSGGQTIFYVNGRLQGSVPRQVTADVLRLGNHPAGADGAADGAVGVLADVRLYGGALGAAAVRELFVASSLQQSDAEATWGGLGPAEAGVWGSEGEAAPAELVLDDAPLQARTTTALTPHPLRSCATYPLIDLSAISRYSAARSRLRFITTSTNPTSSLALWTQAFQLQRRRWLWQMRRRRMKGGGVMMRRRGGQGQAAERQAAKNLTATSALALRTTISANAAARWCRGSKLGLRHRRACCMRSSPHKASCPPTLATKRTVAPASRRRPASC